VQVRAIGNRVAKIDPNAKADGPIGRLLAVMYRNLLLHPDRAPHRAVDAVKNDEQGITTSLDDPANMRFNGRVDYVTAQRT
jgi:hypothetical protein